jgi:succinate dehydrogenase/fumarate reductase flavoprotein subunit
MTSPKNVDLLVLGGGMAGLAAAAWSAQEGRSVVLVEKGELGGSAVHAGFIWTAPSLEVLRSAVPDGDPELGQRLVGDFEPAVDWVRSLGVECLPAVEVLRFGRGHQTAIHNYLHVCERIVRGDSGSEIVLNGHARQLLVEGGRVRGAEVVFPSGEVRTIRAEDTVLATGGFQGDPELRASLIHPNARDIPLRSNPYSCGDGLRLGRDAGARFGADDAEFYGHLMPSGVRLGEHEDFPALTLYYSEHAVLLNVDCHRFVDETVGDHLTTMALLQQPEARGLLISDARVREEWIMRPYVEGIRPTDTFDTCYRRGARCAVAHDLDELTLVPPEWGYDGAAVRQALLDFNRQCVDDSLAPSRRFDAVPIDSPPFYVIEALPAISFTFGGLIVDSEARVLDAEGRPIPGLYAAGADAGGLYVRAYAGGLAAALTFGLRAARSALASAA